jgi:hypothetical protein
MTPLKMKKPEITNLIFGFSLSMLSISEPWGVFDYITRTP